MGYGFGGKGYDNSFVLFLILILLLLSMPYYGYPYGGNK